MLVEFGQLRPGTQARTRLPSSTVTEVSSLAVTKRSG